MALFSQTIQIFCQSMLSRDMLLECFSGLISEINLYFSQDNVNFIVLHFERCPRYYMKVPNFFSMLSTRSKEYWHQWCTFIFILNDFYNLSSARWRFWIILINLNSKCSAENFYKSVPKNISPSVFENPLSTQAGDGVAQWILRGATVSFL